MAQAGVRYWFSMQAHPPDLTVFWGRRSGAASNDRAIQRNAQGATVVLTSDRAFSARSR